MQTSTVSECQSRKTRNEKKNTLKLQSKCYRCKLEKLNSDILHICNINNKCLVGNQGMPSIISTWLDGTFEKLSHIHMKNVLMKFWLVFSHAKHSRSVGTHFHLHSWSTSSDPQESIGQLIRTKRRRSSTNSSCALCIIWPTPHTVPPAARKSV